MKMRLIRLSVKKKEERNPSLVHVCRDASEGFGAKTSYFREIDVTQCSEGARKSN